MLRDAAVARIKLGLDFRLGTADDTNLVSQLQESQRLLEKGKDLPRFLIQEDQNLTVTSGTGLITVPTGFLREVDGQGPHYIDTESGVPVFLEKMSMDEGYLRFADSDPGQPVAYAIRKGSHAFFPERDTSYTLIWSYYKSADALTTNIENVWLANNPEVLIGHAGMTYAEMLGNSAAYQRFNRLFNEAWSAQFAEDIERELDNDPIAMGARL